MIGSPASLKGKVLLKGKATPPPPPSIGDSGRATSGSINSSLISSAASGSGEAEDHDFIEGLGQDDDAELESPHGERDIFSAYVAFDTQLIIARYQEGDRDYIMHAQTLFVDFVQLFIRILAILNDKENDKRRKRDE